MTRFTFPLAAITAITVAVSAPATAHATATAQPAMTLSSASIPADGVVPARLALNGFGCSGRT